MANFASIFKNPHQNNITTAYWCRDQNFRKYFEIRKRHGIAPSVDVSTYYNKKHSKEYYQAQTEYWTDLKNVQYVTGKK